MATEVGNFGPQVLVTYRSPDLQLELYVSVLHEEFWRFHWNIV